MINDPWERAMCEAYKTDMHVRDILDKFGTYAAEFYRILAKHKIPRRQESVIKARNKEIAKRAARMTTSELADKFGLSVSRVRQILRVVR